MKRMTLCHSAVVLFTLAASAQAVITPPGAWWSFDADPLDQLTPGGDGRVFDQGTNGVHLEVFERDGLGGQAIVSHRLARELVVAGLTNSGPSRYVSGAPFPGANEAFHLEGGIHRNYLGNNTRNENTPINGQAANVLFTEDKFSSTRLFVNPTGNPAQADFSNPNVNSNAAGEITYSLWINIPDPVGSNFNNLPVNNFPGGSGERYHDNSFMVISRESAPTEAGADFGGQVRLVLTNPGNPDPIYGVNVRANDNGQGSIQGTTTVAKLGLDQWYHLVVAYGATETKVYLDGILTDTFKIGTFDPGKNSVEPINGDFVFNNVAFQGAQRRESGNFFIDDVGVWQALLTPQEIAQINRLGIAGAINAADVPEPATAMCLALGLFGLASRRTRRA